MKQRPSHAVGWIHIAHSQIFWMQILIFKPQLTQSYKFSTLGYSYDRWVFHKMLRSGRHQLHHGHHGNGGRRNRQLHSRHSIPDMCSSNCTENAANLCIISQKLYDAISSWVLYIWWTCIQRAFKWPQDGQCQMTGSGINTSPVCLFAWYVYRVPWVSLDTDVVCTRDS